MRQICKLFIFCVFLYFGSSLIAGIAWVPTIALTVAPSTSTTLVMSPDLIVKKEDSDRLRQYVKENSAVVACDIARGQGESLSTVSDILNIPQENRQAFQRSLQANFSSIYANDSNSEKDVADTIVRIAVRFV